MDLQGTAKLLRIFLGESDTHKHMPIFEHIVIEARKAGLAGCTVVQGVMGYGKSSRIHTAKILRLSEDLPIVVEIVDMDERIEKFIPIITELFSAANCGGLVTTENVSIVSYTNNSQR